MASLSRKADADSLPFICTYFVLFFFPLCASIVVRARSSQGGAGYIGSHTCLQLLNAGCKVVVVDNLDNSCVESLKRVKELLDDPANAANITFHNCDILDKDCLDAAFAAQKVDAVIHFAGLKAVGESVAQPMKYYSNNIAGTIVLVDVMEKHE